MNRNANWTRPAMLQRAVMTLILIAGCATLLTGCTSPTVSEIPADRWVVTLEQGQTFTAPVRGKFVPQAQFNDMLDAYLREGFRSSKPSP